MRLYLLFPGTDGTRVLVRKDDPEGDIYSSCGTYVQAQNAW
jgi:hypothetical protein